jgi:endoglucanase
MFGGLVATVALALADTGQAASPKVDRWPLWEAYASAFLDGQGRVIDRQGNDRTTSEGQSYGLFFALVDNDRERFDRLLHWTTDNLAGGDLGARLPGWLWGKSSSGQWTMLDRHSAADADLWIAYTLCEAGRLWHEPKYLDLGHRLLALIAAQEVAELPGFGAMLLPANVGFHPSPDTWVLNPSYLPLPILTGLGNVDPKGPWRAIAGSVPTLLEKSARRGFAMDWLRYRAKDGFQPASKPDSKEPAGGSYDAIRVYLWAGLTHAETPGASETLHAVSGMADYLASHPIPPEHINSSGVVVGSKAPVGFSAALLPYLDALGAKTVLAAQSARVTDHLDPATHLCCDPVTYYDENLTLFGLGNREHLFAFGREGELQLRW